MRAKTNSARKRFRLADYFVNKTSKKNSPKPVESGRLFLSVDKLFYDDAVGTFEGKIGRAEGAIARNVLLRGRTFVGFVIANIKQGGTIIYAFDTD